MSRGKISIGIDVRAKDVIVATLKREGRRTSLTDLQVLSTPQLLERGSYRDTHHVIEAVNQAIEAHITTNPRLAMSAVRSRTLMTTVPLKGLTRQKATQVITAQANRHFPNPADLTLAVDTAHLRVRGRKPKTNSWLAAATPTEHLQALGEIEEGISRTIARYEPKAIATLRAAHPHVTEPGDHIILAGGDDGADLTLVLDGVIELVRLVGTDLEHDITPELARTIDYLSGEGREAPTLHLAAYQEHAQRLADALNVNVTTVTPWDALTLPPELEEDTALLEAGVTAIGLALGVLDDPTPDANLRPATRRAKPTQAGSSAAAPRGNLLQAASLALVLAAGGYHFMTTLGVNDLRSDVQRLQAQLATSTSPERMRVAELQTSIDELLRHEALAEDLTRYRLRPTEHIQRVVANLPSTTRSRTGDGLRFQSLNLRVATEVPPAHQPLPMDADPATIITIAGVAPDNITLENDLRALEAHPGLLTHVRHANRVNTDDPSDPSLATQIEVLTLHQPAGKPADAQASVTALPLEEHQ